MKFAERLEEKRRELGLNQRAMAEKIGVSQSVYSRYANGKIHPIKSSIEHIAKMLDVPFEWMQGLDVPPNENNVYRTYADLIRAMLRMIADGSVGGFTMDEVGSMDGRAGIRITSYDPNLYNFFQCYETFKGLRDAGNITDSAFETMIGSLVSALDGKAESE